MRRPSRTWSVPTRSRRCATATRCASGCATSSSSTSPSSSGAWELSPEQYPKLERLARAILRILRRNPDEVVLIEGHTDAVGSDVDNLSLSDRRASAVAEVLTDTFGVPPENLVTQGYGEQFPKVNTLAAEPLNRRVDVRRITPLMSER